MTYARIKSAAWFIEQITVITHLVQCAILIVMTKKAMPGKQCHTCQYLGTLAFYVAMSLMSSKYI